MNKGRLSKILKIVGKTLLWIAGIWLALLIVLEIALSGPVLTRIVNRYTAEYIDGDLHFGKVSASMFRRFPAAVLTLDDCSLTYPSERFDSIGRVGPQGHLMYAGCAETADTLASFRKFSVGLSLPALVTGTIKVPYMRLDKPRIFAHSYADGSANWDIFITGGEETEEADTTESSGGIPKIVIGKVMMTGRPHIVYTDSRDTIFAAVGLRRMELNGHINSRRISRSRIGLTLDSMFVAGRISRDTLALGLDRLYMHEDGKKVKIDLDSKAFVATRNYGRIRVPINLSGILSFPKDSVPAARLDSLKMDIAHIPLTGQADLRFMQGRTAVKADAGIDKCSIGRLLHDYVSHIIPEAGKVSTDAVIDMKVHADGFYNHTTGQLPQMLAELTIPDSHVSYEDLPGGDLTIGVSAKAEVDRRGDLGISISRMAAGLSGLELAATAGASGLLGKDPEIRIDGNVRAVLDSLRSFIPDSLGIEAEGKISATVKGSAKMSQLNIYNFSTSSLTGEILGNGINVNMPKDTINANLDGIRITVGPDKRISRRDSTRVINLIGITGEIARADISYKEALSLKAAGFAVSAKNIVDSDGQVDTTKKIHPFRGTVKAGSLSLRDSDGTSLRLSESSNSFNIFPKKGQPSTPVLTLTSRNKRISFRYDVNRGSMSDANLRVSASMNTFETRRRMSAFVDSLARIYPYIPKDSLVRHHMAMTRKRMPSYAIPEDDFKGENIDISLDRSLARYFREWDLKGNLKVDGGRIMTPYFPLRNTLEGFELSFNNDRIGIDTLGIKSGGSDISASGELTGLKKALLGRRGALKLDLDIVSEKMNANELLAAYTKGASFTGSGQNPEEDMDDDKFMEEIAIDSTSVPTESALIVIPGNLNADVRLAAENIDYSNLHIDLMTANLKVKDRCVRITETQALTNMGAMDLEGFYATRSRKDIKTGFSLNFNDITAEKVISLMPAVDTLMPLLKSFGGMLNCELAATAQIDTNMNILMPSINGIMRIGGEDLYIKNNEMFRKMAKLLVFKNKKEGHIDKMTVEGVIKDSKVEVFPFIVEMDRYILGLSGVQNMDMSFRYHASLIKSPFLIKVGMDVYGPDFDNMKFKIGKPKYKSKDVPVFSTIIDNTKINLVESIRNVFDKGVDVIIRENSAHKAIEEHKRRIGYVQAVDQQMEELSAAEQRQLEEEQQAEDTTERSTGQLPD